MTRSLLFLAAGLAVAGFVMMGIRQSCTQAAAVVVATITIDLSSVEVGTTAIAISVHNSTDRAVTVIGLQEDCGTNCCHRTGQLVPIVIHAGATAEVPCTISVPRAGPFETTIIVFLDDGGIKEITVPARGTGNMFKE